MTTLAAGIYPDLSFEDYHAIDAASNSRLTQIARSPAHLQSYLHQPPKSTAALEIGRAVHTAVLEPDDFAMRFCVAQQCEAQLASGPKKGDQCGNPGVKFVNGTWFCGQHSKGLGSDESRVVISADEHAICLGIRDSVHAHRAASALLTSNGGQEVSAVWDYTDPLAELGIDLQCKARFDKHAPGFAAIVDLKTTENASRVEFERSIFKYGLHRQGAFYLDAAAALNSAANHYVLIVAEKSAPFAVAVYRLDESAISAGREQLRPLLRRYAECVESGVWPAYSEDVVDVGLPSYAYGQIDAELREAGV